MPHNHSLCCHDLTTLLETSVFYVSILRYIIALPDKSRFSLDLPETVHICIQWLIKNTWVFIPESKSDLSDGLSCKIIMIIIISMYNIHALYFNVKVIWYDIYDIFKEVCRGSKCHHEIEKSQQKLPSSQLLFLSLMFLIRKASSFTQTSSRGKTKIKYSCLKCL